MTTPTEPQVPISFPSYFNAGTTLKVDRFFTDYPASDWTYTWYLVGASVLSVQATSDTNGVDFHLVVSAEQTATLTPGAYKFVGRLTASDGEVVDVENGRIMVNPDPALLQPGDAVSNEEKTLAVIEAAIAGRLTKDMESYSIGGRSVTRIPIKDLLQLRGTYRSLVWRQRNPGMLTVPVDVNFPVENVTPWPAWWKGQR